MPTLPSPPAALTTALRQCRHLVVFTGAGVSAESGIPTFRDALTGLWSRFDAMDLATPDAFDHDPATVWGWYEWRRLRGLAAQPNAAHRAITALARRVPRLTLVTQNVDDLHERAGSTGVLHLHGSLHEPRCSRCGAPFEPPTRGAATVSHTPGLACEVVDIEGDGERLPPPRCAACGGAVRPGVVWFGETLPAQALEAAYAAAESCDVLLSVGTSGLVEPAAGIPRAAVRAGAWVAHVNPQPLPLQGAREVQLSGAAGAVLPRLLAAMDG